MNPRIPDMSVRKLSSAIAAATLMGIAGQASAVPVSVDLDYMCTLPLIGDDVVAANVTSDLPAEIGVGEPTGAFDLVANTTITDNSRGGLKLVNTASISGTANADAVLDTPGLNLPLTVPLVFPETTVPNTTGPFTVVAEGSTPSLTFQESQAGTVTITVGDLELIVDTRTSTGDPTGLGEFTAPCSLQSSNDVLHQFEVIPPCTDGNCGEDLPPEIAVSPANIDFGNTQAGMSKTETITISNTGDLDLGINSISLDGATEFSKSNDNCTTVAGSSSCTVDITFAPSTAGDFTGNVTIDSNAVNNDELPPVGLSGTGELEPTPILGVSTTSVNFGQVTPGETAPETVTITNEGTGTLSNIVVGQLTGDSEFQREDNCTGQSLAEGESCDVPVSFTPSAEGVSYIASFDVTSDGGDSTVTLEGSGKEGGEITVPIMADIEGSTFIARSGGTLPITGSIAAELTVASGDIEADLALDPTVANFAIIKGWNSWTSTAQVEFEQTRPTTGTLVDGKLKTSSEMYVYVPKVTAPIFGFNVKIGGGENCRTSEPSVINLESADGANISPTSGGKLSGTYSLAELENCGWLTGLVSAYMAGDGNTLDLDLSIIQ